MKKLIALLITFALVCCLSVPAFAADDTWTNDGADEFSSDVSATYVQDKIDAYKVTIEWGALEFTYTDTAQIWNTTTHTWDDVEDSQPYWSVNEEGGDIITITNYSSQPIYATLAVAEVEGFDNIDYTFTSVVNYFDYYSYEDYTGTSWFLNNATDQFASNAVITVSLDGALASTTADNTIVANITIVITDASTM